MITSGKSSQVGGTVQDALRKIYESGRTLLFQTTTATIDKLVKR